MSDQSSEVGLGLSIDGSIAILEIDRPARKNRLTDPLLKQLGLYIAELEGKPEIKAVILRSTGDVFSTGFDIHSSDPSMATKTRARYYDHISLVRDALTRIWHSPLPFVAALQGQCLGGAVYLTAMCDFVLASDDLEIGMSELKLGMSPPLFNVFPWLMGMRDAREFLYFGDVVNGKRAVEMGLASHCVPRAELQTFAMELATKLARMPERVIRNMKASVNRRWELAGMLTGIEADLRNFVEDKLPPSDFLKQYNEIAKTDGGAKAAEKLGVNLGLKNSEHPW